MIVLATPFFRAPSVSTSHVVYSFVLSIHCLDVLFSLHFRVTISCIEGVIDHDCSGHFIFFGLQVPRCPIFSTVLRDLHTS
jgi:hypothetical protein